MSFFMLIRELLIMFTSAFLFMTVHCQNLDSQNLDSQNLDRQNLDSRNLDSQYRESSVVEIP
jgi:hypothetical protein